MKLPKFFLLFSLAFLILFSLPVHATVNFNITNSSDTYAREGTPTTNWGNEDYINLVSLTGQNSYPFFMIDHSLIPANTTSMSVVLHIRKFSDVGNALRNITVYNTSLAWNETNLTWNNKPAASILINFSNINGTKTWYEFNITNAVKSSINSGSNFTSIMLKDNVNNTTQFTSIFYSHTGSVAFAPYVEVMFTTAGNCSTAIIGSYCDLTDPTNRTILTTPDYSCENDLLYICPSGTRCSQITPQVNITTPLIENFTDCSKCFYTYSSVLGLFPVLLKTNCPSNPECNPGIANISGIYYSNCLSGSQSPIIYTCPGVFITANDSTPADFYNYTAGCYDSTLGRVPIVIDEIGNQTTINNLTIRIFGDSTNLTNSRLNNCPNSTTSCYVLVNSTCQPAVCEPTTGSATSSDTTGSAAGQFAGLFGTMFGITDSSVALAVFSFFISLGIGFVLMYYTRNSPQGGNTFIFGTLAPLVMFAIMGWFPAWIIVILLVAAAFLVAKSMGLGGG